MKTLSIACIAIFIALLTITIFRSCSNKSINEAPTTNDSQFQTQSQNKNSQ